MQGLQSIRFVMSVDSLSEANPRRGLFATAFRVTI